MQWKNFSIILLACNLLVLPAVAEQITINGVRLDSGRARQPIVLDDRGDLLDSIATPFNYTTGVAWDGQQFWCADIINVIFRMTREGIVTDSFGGWGPAALAWDGAYLWNVIEQEARLHKLDPTTGAVVDSFLLPDHELGDPNSWGIMWDGHSLWHSSYMMPDYDHSTIYQLDPMDAQVISSFVLPGSILGLAWDGQCICGVNRMVDSLYRFDSTGTLIEQLAWPVANALDLTWDGTDWWCSVNSLGVIYQVDGQSLAVDRTINLRPDQFALEQNYPNPFNSTTQIKYRVARTGPVELKIFDVIGREVRTIVDFPQNPGEYEIRFDGNSQATGTYFVRLRAGGFTHTQKLMLLK